MKQHRATRVPAGAILVALCACPQAAWSQDQEAGQATTSEIIVTAQRRAERAVDVPITVTTLGADQLATANARDLCAHAPCG